MLPVNLQSSAPSTVERACGKLGETLENCKCSTWIPWRLNLNSAQRRSHFLHLIVSWHSDPRSVVKFDQRVAHLLSRLSSLLVCGYALSIPLSESSIFNLFFSSDDIRTSNISWHCKLYPDYISFRSSSELFIRDVSFWAGWFVSPSIAIQFANTLPPCTSFRRCIGFSRQIRFNTDKCISGLLFKQIQWICTLVNSVYVLIDGKNIQFHQFTWLKFCAIKLEYREIK